ncbi:radical SAM family protein [Planctomycetales bacterium]|nr:radical SAM family protein [Planctomycetales bacterium]
MISITEIKERHPCFAMGKPNNKGRIHLPVSPGCNIECLFCNRQFNTTEQRPGVAAQIISPQEAVEVVRRSLAIAPEITVVGIAGPGDTLATSYALETFRLIANMFPQLIKCMSTNGLLLEDKAEEVIAAGINTLTVTVNDVFSETLPKLCGKIMYRNRIYEGKEAAEILIGKQLAGIRRVTQTGVIVKVNTVLVPEINGGHIDKIAQTVKEAGASLYNIIPLIPQYRLSHCKVPSCSEIDSARGAAEGHISVFRHCQHCRADAIGVPGGRDYGEQIYQKRVSAKNTFSHG